MPDCIGIYVTKLLYRKRNQVQDKLYLQFRECHFALPLGCSGSLLLRTLNGLQVVFAPQEQLPLSKAILQLDPVRRLW